MDFETPRQIKTDGYLTLDTNADHITGIVLPVNDSLKPMHGTLTLMSQDYDGEDYRTIEDLVTRQPIATPMGAYQVKIQVYCSDVDKLRVFPKCYGLDAVAFMLWFMDEGDTKLEWDWKK